MHPGDHGADRAGAAVMPLRDTPVWETPAVIVGPFGTSLGFKALPTAVPPVLPASGSLSQGLLTASSSLRGSLRQSGSIRLKERDPVAFASGGPGAALATLDVQPGSDVRNGAYPRAVGGGLRGDAGGGDVAGAGGGGAGGGAGGRGARRGSMVIRGAGGSGTDLRPRTGPASTAEKAGPVQFSSGVPHGDTSALAGMGVGGVGNVPESTGATDAPGGGVAGQGGGGGMRLVGRRASWSMHESELDGSIAAAQVQQGRVLIPRGGQAGGLMGAGVGVAALEGGAAAVGGGVAVAPGPGAELWGATGEEASQVRTRFRARRRKPTSFRGPDTVG